MKTFQILLTSLALLFFSCNPAEDVSEVVEKTEVSKEKEKIEERNETDEISVKNEPTEPRKSKIVEDKTAPLLQQHPFFKEIKNSISGTQDGMKIIVSSKYEFIEKDGKEILDGKACVNLMAMGYGESLCANFKEGKLHGTAYKTLSAPSTYMLLLQYKNEKLLEASFFTIDLPSCKQYGPLKGKGKDELYAEFDKIIQGKESIMNKFKDAECPAEANELFN